MKGVGKMISILVRIISIARMNEVAYASKGRET
jgi:hypothetical protein